MSKESTDKVKSTVKKLSKESTDKVNLVLTKVLSKQPANKNNDYRVGVHKGPPCLYLTYCTYE